MLGKDANPVRQMGTPIAAKHAKRSKGGLSFARRVTAFGLG